MAPGSPTPDLIQQTTETVARFIQWIAELIRRRNWFMLLVLLGVALAILGHFFRAQINSRFLAEAAQGPFWASFWTGVVLLFVGALAVAVVTMPRPASDSVVDEAERKAIKGLRPFSRDDAAIFAQLQREVSLRECSDAVTSDTYKFGILMGESGCGKTSFLQAGLWPKLSEPGSSHRAIYIRFSDQEPMATVRKALAEQLEVPVDWLRTPFSQVLTQALDAAGKPIVLLLDQFEQFFVHTPRKEDRAPFVQSLTAWYQDSRLNHVKLLVSIRADLLHELYELHEALQYTLGPQDLFKLDRFTPAEATKILAVIADTEHLDFDPRFVTKLAERELAHRESGTISPVDLQILAWMIERQKSDDLRAFNRTAFRKFGGVEGLLTRFLERTLDARVLPNQRQAAIKTLLALTDLDQQVLAGVLTVAELQSKLKDTAKPDEIQDAVTWLSRSDVRLITSQDKDGTLGYELAHERLIPSLRRLAGKELTAADKANQLLERRVNEWLGNQQHARYLLGWRELSLIQRQRPYLVGGAKHRQKERLIRQSQRRTYAVLGIVGAVAITLGTFYTWLNFTTPGQIQQVRWALARGIERASDDTKGEIANALIKDGQYARGMVLIRNEIESRGSRSAALQEVAKTAVRLPEPKLLQMALGIASKMGVPASKSSALSAIASAYGQLEESTQAHAVLEQALTVVDTIDEPYSKSSALSILASTYGQLKDATQARAVLEQALTVVDTIDDPYAKSYALRDIASAYGQMEESTQARAVLEQALTATNAINDPYAKSYALRDIASAYGQMEESTQARAVLEQALTATNAIDAPYSSSALRDIASTAGRIPESTQARAVLDQALTATDAINNPNSKSSALSAIASAYGQLQESTQARAILEQALNATDAVNNPNSSSALSAIASAYGQLQESTQARAILEQALNATDAINNPDSKSSALSAIASAYGQLQESTQARAILEQALNAAESIDDPDSKSSALSAIASAAGQLPDANVARNLLVQIRQVAERVRASKVLSQIAADQALYGNWQTALRTLRTCLEGDKVGALQAILTHYAASKTPQLIDGPVVLSVDAVLEASGQYALSVKLQSPDKDCERHTDWWEVLSEEGELLDRHLIDTPHGFEQPFTTEKVMALDPNQIVIIRAHFSDDIDGNPDNDDDQYTTQAMKGRVGKPKRFKSIRLPARFAIEVEADEPQPGECRLI